MQRAPADPREREGVPGGAPAVLHRHGEQEPLQGGGLQAPAHGGQGVLRAHFG